jgi:hypothetical protein
VAPPSRRSGSTRGTHTTPNAAAPELRFSLVEVCTGVDDVTIVYRNHRDIVVTEALRLRDDGLASEVRVCYGA